MNMYFFFVYVCKYICMRVWKLYCLCYEGQSRGKFQALRVCVCVFVFRACMCVFMMYVGSLTYTLIFTYIQMIKNHQRDDAIYTVCMCLCIYACVCV